jgi:hypothetical protein
MSWTKGTPRDLSCLITNDMTASRLQFEGTTCKSDLRWVWTCGPHIMLPFATTCFFAWS